MLASSKRCQLQEFVGSGSKASSPIREGRPNDTVHIDKRGTQEWVVQVTRMTFKDCASKTSSGFRTNGLTETSVHTNVYLLLQ